MTIDQRIAALRPGESMELPGGWAMCFCTVERSGNGTQLRWVRHTPSEWTVFHTTEWKHVRM